MAVKRTDRLNALLQQVISDVIRKEVGNPKVTSLLSVTAVDVAPNLSTAKVSVSILADEKGQKETLKALRSAAGFIRSRAGQQVSLRCFPELRFVLDESAAKQMRVEHLLKEISEKRECQDCCCSTNPEE